MQYIFIFNGIIIVPKFHIQPLKHLPGKKKKTKVCCEGFFSMTHIAVIRVKKFELILVVLFLYL